MAFVEVEVRGLEETILRFSRLSDTLRDESALAAELGAVILNRTRTRFLAETDPDGNKWPQSEAARTGRGRVTGPGKTLFDTGTLFGSLQAFGVQRRGKGAVALGTDVPYAPDHQLGLRNLPERKFLGFSDDDISTMELILVQKVEQAFR